MAKKSFDINVSGKRGTTTASRLYSMIFAETEGEAKKQAKARYKALFKGFSDIVVETKKKRP